MLEGQVIEGHEKESIEERERIGCGTTETFSYWELRP
jgi:hypothetical protein